MVKANELRQIMKNVEEGKSAKILETAKVMCEQMSERLKELAENEVTQMVIIPEFKYRDAMQKYLEDSGYGVTIVKATGKMMIKQ